MGRIYKNDVGVELQVSVTADLTDSTKMELHVKKPVSGTEVTWTASKYDATTLSYTTQSGDLDESGEYQLQAYVEWTTGSKHLGETKRFVISDKYD